MKKELSNQFFNNSELFDLYQNLFSIPKNKKVTDTETLKINVARAKSTRSQYESLSNELGVNRKKLSLYDQLKRADPKLDELFEFDDFHNKVVQSIFISCNVEDVLNSSHEILKSVYVELLCFLDYLERELSKFKTFYIFKFQENNESIIDEIIEKFFVPQICSFLLYNINYINDNLNQNEHHYLVLTQVDHIIKLILSCRFDITKAFKKNTIQFIKALQKTKSETAFYESFRDINDNKFPSLSRLKNWLEENFKNNVHNNFFNEIISQHKIFSIFIKIKKIMKNRQYSFNYLILDMYYYLNPLILDQAEKIQSSIVGNYYNRLPHYLGYSCSDFFKRKIDFIHQHFEYCILNAQSSSIKNKQLTTNPDASIYDSINFLHKDNLPSDLLKYLKYGLKNLKVDTDIEIIIDLFKKHNNDSEGFYPIYLFTKSLNHLIQNNIESAKEKIKLAYAEMDKYPIGTLFYKYILIFYIGICNIKKRTPHQFTKKISYITNYSRFNFSSLIMQNEYNILNREKSPTTSYVEDLLLIQYMSIYNDFCIDHSINDNLLFNPFTAIEHFHSVISAEIENGFYGKKINSFSDILDYKNSAHYKNLCNKKTYKNILTKNPKIDFSHASVEDFYRHRAFYLSNIKKLRLTDKLNSTIKILNLF